ncbi:MAG: formimidoylglutamate deiminase [Pseudomonadota bacterium]
MQTIWAKQALTPTGWQRDVSVAIGSDGRIDSVTADTAAHTAAEGERVDCLIPAPVNAHSHAFQRAMTGMTEYRGANGQDNSQDSFWSWRRLMFRFLQALDPDQVEAIAAYVQMEMLEAGYATNVEFHYLHQGPGGTPYNRLSEMSSRIAAAAAQTGIGLTLLPVFYQYGGLDQRPLAAGQDRFGNDLDRFTQLVGECGSLVDEGPDDWALGIAPHSLRAVAPDDLKQLANLFPDGPIHMHVAEQIPEVEEVQSALGQRPVEWVLDNLHPSARWHFIHLTQMVRHETEALAKTGATAVLCPMTEANLGDGIFDGVAWLRENGQIAIGSDSNIRISLSGELRQLEYSQRLRDHSRAALATVEKPTGRRLFDAACQGGAASAQRQTGRIEAGQWADLTAIALDHADLEGLGGDAILDAFIFARDDSVITDVWSAGRHMVKEGQHIHRAGIDQAYRQTIRQLRDVS